MFRAVLFDVDGTLVDSNELHVDAWDEAFRHFGKQFTRAQLHEQVGKGGDNYIPSLLNAAEVQSFGDELNKFRGDIFKEKYMDRVQPFPKVRELFERIRNDGKRIVLASSGNEDEIQHYIKLLNVRDVADVYTTKTDVKHSKPNPDIFARALTLVDVSADDAVVVGDTPYDVQAAKKIDVRTIGVLCGGFPEDQLRASGAIAIFHDPADLLENYTRSPLCG
ncbi:MAG: HAD family hydrolase [Chthoniobacterales bacterium]